MSGVAIDQTGAAEHGPSSLLPSPSIPAPTLPDWILVELDICAGDARRLGPTLRALAETEGRQVSAAQLADVVGVARRTIWNHIRELEGRGFVICRARGGPRTNAPGGNVYEVPATKERSRRLRESGRRARRAQRMVARADGGGYVPVGMEEHEQLVLGLGEGLGEKGEGRSGGTSGGGRGAVGGCQLAADSVGASDETAHGIAHASAKTAHGPACACTRNCTPLKRERKKDSLSLGKGEGTRERVPLVPAGLLREALGEQSDLDSIERLVRWCAGELARVTSGEALVEAVALAVACARVASSSPEGLFHAALSSARGDVKVSVGRDDRERAFKWVRRVRRAGEIRRLMAALEAEDPSMREEARLVIVGQALERRHPGERWLVEMVRRMWEGTEGGTDGR